MWFAYTGGLVGLHVFGFEEALPASCPAGSVYAATLPACHTYCCLRAQPWFSQRLYHVCGPPNGSNIPEVLQKGMLAGDGTCPMCTAHLGEVVAGILRQASCTLHDQLALHTALRDVHFSAVRGCCHVFKSTAAFMFGISANALRYALLDCEGLLWSWRLCGGQ
jgi:hypothetical protein